MYQKKIWSFLLILALLSSFVFVLPLNAHAEETTAAESETETAAEENTAEEKKEETAAEAETGEEESLVSSYPLSAKDSEGNELQINAEPRRIVSLGPNMSELLFALGAGDRLVGRTKYCDYPEAVSEIPEIGTLMEPDLERITELKPDLVLASTHVQDEVLDKLRELEIPVLSFYEQEDAMGIFKISKELARILNLQAEGAKLQAFMQAKFDRVSRVTKALEKPSIYYVVGFGEGGDFTAGAKTFVNGLLEAAGAKNIAGEIEGWSFDQEKLVEADPDYILIPKWADGQFQSTAPYSELTAVKEGRVLVVDNNLIDRQGPRNADAVLMLARLFHPEAFAGNSYPLTLKGNDGSELTLEKKVEKVISLGPNMTEMLFALGAGERLVGRTDYCDYPEEVKEVTAVGSLMEPDLEKIAEIAPDLVLASTHVQEETLKKLAELKIPVLMLYDEHSLYGLSEIILSLGEALDLNEKAAEVEADVMGRILNARYTNERKERATAYYVVGFGEGGDYTAGGDSFINDMLTAAGFENIAKEIKGWSFSQEKLVELNPDYIIIPQWADGMFQSSAPYSELKAVKEGKVIVVDNNLFDRQGVRNAEGVEVLSEANEELPLPQAA